MSNFRIANAHALMSCFPEQYEGTNYNGKRIFVRNDDLDKDLVAKRQAKLKELEMKFEHSVQIMEDAEAAKKDMTRMSSTSASIMSNFTPCFPRLNAHATASTALRPEAHFAGYVSSTVLETNTRILAQQMALNSVDRNMAAALACNGSLSMASFDSFHEANAMAEALSGTRANPAVSFASRRMGVPASGPNTVLDRMLIQRQYDCLLSEVLTRARLGAENAHLLGSTLGSAAPAPHLQQQPEPISQFGRMELKRPPQLPSFVPLASNKKAKLV